MFKVVCVADIFATFNLQSFDKILSTSHHISENRKGENKIINQEEAVDSEPGILLLPVEKSRFASKNLKI